MGKIIVNGTMYSRSSENDLSTERDTLYELQKYIENQQNNTNCPNCGAPITGKKCEYCGTEFCTQK